MSDANDGGQGFEKGSSSELDHFLEVMRAHDLVELEVKDGDRTVRLSRAAAFAPAPFLVQPSAAVPAAPVASVAPPAPTRQAIVSPLAGMFYRSPAPNTPAFVKEGDALASGVVVCIVEAMKVMNEIRSDRPGRIYKILAENGKPVSAGQELFLLDPISD